MTLILTGCTPEMLWMVADRRLSYGDGRPPRDDARKIMFLETTDGCAILGYAGLGATVGKTEPSDWMSRVLRGRNLPLERSLEVLGEAVKQQLPRHLRQLRRDPVHHIPVTAFLNGEPRFYSIDIVSEDRRLFFRCTRHACTSPTLLGEPLPPPIEAVGSGAAHVRRQGRLRHVLSLIRACDRGRVSPRVVAACLARLTADVSRSENTVGPRCVVAWRSRNGGFHKSGGAYQFYTDGTEDGSSLGIPTILNGFDARAISDATMPMTTMRLEAMLDGESIDEAELTRRTHDALARLPTTPDETLH